MPTQYKLIYTTLEENSNKFWEGERKGPAVSYRWGRVGEAGGASTKHLGSDDQAQRDLDRTAAAKLKKGYTHQATVGGAAPVTGSLGAIARQQIRHGSCAETGKLIDFLVKRNIHAIEGATTLKWTGKGFTTPLGPVTAAGIDQAEAVLGCIDAKIDGSADLSVDVNAYLRLVPMHVKRNTRDARTIFHGRAVVQEQYALLDALRAVLKDAEQAGSADAPEVFSTQLALVDPAAAEFAKVRRRFIHSVNDRHQAASAMTLKAAWQVQVAGADEAFAADGARVGNVMELWHGTTDGNLLSLLKTGYKIVSRGSAARVTGRMFGDGLYFSDQSTKALNYAIGGWGAGRSARAFMLLNEVAMGKSYVPSGPFSGGCRPGYDSTFAKGRQSGVLNNEMIVYRASRVRPIFLCEFE